MPNTRTSRVGLRKALKVRTVLPSAASSVTFGAPYFRSSVRPPHGDTASILSTAYLAAQEGVAVPLEDAYLATSPTGSVLRDHTFGASYFDASSSPPPHSVLHCDLSPTTLCVLHGVPIPKYTTQELDESLIPRGYDRTELMQRVARKLGLGPRECTKGTIQR